MTTYGQFECPMRRMNRPALQERCKKQEKRNIFSSSLGVFRFIGMYREAFSFLLRNIPCTITSPTFTIRTMIAQDNFIGFRIPSFAGIGAF